MLLFDTLSVMIAGAESDEVRAFAVQFAEPGSAPLIGLSRRTSIEGSLIMFLHQCFLSNDVDDA